MIWEMTRVIVFLLSYDGEISYVEPVCSLYTTEHKLPSVSRKGPYFAAAWEFAIHNMFQPWGGLRAGVVPIGTAPWHPCDGRTRRLLSLIQAVLQHAGWTCSSVLNWTSAEFLCVVGTRNTAVPGCVTVWAGPRKEAPLADWPRQLGTWLCLLCWDVSRCWLHTNGLEPILESPLGLLFFSKAFVLEAISRRPGYS